YLSTTCSQSKSSAPRSKSIEFWGRAFSSRSMKKRLLWTCTARNRLSTTGRSRCRLQRPLDSRSAHRHARRRRGDRGNKVGLKTTRRCCGPSAFVSQGDEIEARPVAQLGLRSHGRRNQARFSVSPYPASPCSLRHRWLSLPTSA